jgi:arylsulfatase A-like enzyme
VKGKLAQFKAMVRYTDTLLGRLIAHLDQSGQRDQTIVIWLTDNGSAGGITGDRQGRQIRGGKGKTSEAGVNVPVIIRAPQISQSFPPGSRCDALIDVTDYFPTFVELAGAEMPAGFQYDGQSFASLLRGEAMDSPRQWIMAMGGGNHAQPTTAGVENKFVFRDRVIRDKRFKLYVGPSPSKPLEKLIDLENDPAEQVNLLGRDDANLRSALARFQSVVDSFPVRDNDPSYRLRAANPWDKPITVESQSWKQ